MAKYTIDVDALLECLDFVSAGKLNGNEYAYLADIKAFITKFPKDEAKGSINYREYLRKQLEEEQNE